VSPLLLRRYRADRLLREEFEALRERVLGLVARRLRAAGLAVDRDDLDAAYAQAWHGLHSLILEGRPIENPAGWLVVVAHRRALDEHRARRSAREAPFEETALQEASRRGGGAVRGQDLAREVDDRARLRTLIGAWRARLSERERQAAALCYLQGLSRAEAAVQLGVSPARMRKLMDGGGGLAGVAAKVGVLAQSIAAGEWCRQQGSLMRGLAFGILDPEGERYRQALAHSDECSACRSYVLSLRGLAAALPPLPTLLHWASGGAATTAAGAGGLAGAVSAPAGSTGAGAPGAASSAAGVGSGSGLAAAGALPSYGVAGAGAGAVGGGWWLAGGVGAKLAVGCLLALGVGAGCLALERSRGGPGTDRGHRHAQLERRPRASARLALASGSTASAPRTLHETSSAAARSDQRLAAAGDADREFGPEAELARHATAGAPPKGESTAAGASPTARDARARTSGTARELSTATAATVARAAPQAASVPAATREFGAG
jgi:RNA polymerase sigma factor (sigma-70 family)